MVRRNNGALGFDIAQKTFYTDGKLLLFTSTQNDAPFTFGLLFVKKGDATRGKFIENVSYTHPNIINLPAGEVLGGDDYYWNIETGFTDVAGATTLTSLADCEIYMIVTAYEGFSEDDLLAVDNIIKIK